MPRTPAQAPVKARPIDKAEPRFAYRQVEQALAEVFSLGPEEREGKLRARLIHLRRSGLPSYGPGKGKAISYTQHQVDQWAVALALRAQGRKSRRAACPADE